MRGRRPRLVRGREDGPRRSRPLTNPRRESRQGMKTREVFGAPVRRPPRRILRNCLYPERLSATDISALASMKNVAKCDTWCELQNPVNHRVFERKLRPKPLGRGHVCLGVTHRCPRSNPPHCGREAKGAEIGLPRAPRERLAQKRVYGSECAATICGDAPSICPFPRRARRLHAGTPRTLYASRGARTATPGQAGLPAEFKHINKRRKRNLPGFP